MYCATVGHTSFTFHITVHLKITYLSVQDESTFYCLQRTQAIMLVNLTHVSGFKIKMSLKLPQPLFVLTS